MFLYIDPIKQGLKQEERWRIGTAEIKFLYIDPIKQGLKRNMQGFGKESQEVFIHRSIKTRIETHWLNKEQIA